MAICPICGAELVWKEIEYPPQLMDDGEEYTDEIEEVYICPRKTCNFTGTEHDLYWEPDQDELWDEDY